MKKENSNLSTNLRFKQKIWCLTKAYKEIIKASTFWMTQMKLLNQLKNKLGKTAEIKTKTESSIIMKSGMISDRKNLAMYLWNARSASFNINYWSIFDNTLQWMGEVSQRLKVPISTRRCGKRSWTTWRISMKILKSCPSRSLQIDHHSAILNMMKNQCSEGVIPL